MPTILYILSDVRSGSTLLENILSSSRDFVSVGEMSLLDSHIHKGKWGATWNWNCSCGKPVIECEFWISAAKGAGLESISDIERTNLNSGDDAFYKNELNEKDVVKLIDDLYESVSQNNNNASIIDSSKSPRQLSAILRYSRHPIAVIFLRRDIRAVSISKKKWGDKIKGNKGRSLIRIMLSSAYYDFQCCQLLRKKTYSMVSRVNYEDLARSPNCVTNRILEEMKFNSINVPHSMDCVKTHTIAGTPTRFEATPIKYDDSWEVFSRGNPVFHLIGMLVNSFRKIFY